MGGRRGPARGVRRLSRLARTRWRATVFPAAFHRAVRSRHPRRVAEFSTYVFSSHRFRKPCHSITASCGGKFCYDLRLLDSVMSHAGPYVPHLIVMSVTRDTECASLSCVIELCDGWHVASASMLLHLFTSRGPDYSCALLPTDSSRAALTGSSRARPCRVESVTPCVT